MIHKGEFKKIEVHNEEGVIVSSETVYSMDNRISLFGDELPVLPHHTLVEGFGYLEDGYIQMSGEITLSTETQLNIEIKEMGELNERRNYIKVKTKFKISLLRAYALGNSKKSLAVNESKETRDLSLGGVCFYSNRKFFKNQKLLIDFDHIKPNLITAVKVLRKDRDYNQTGYKYTYGCEFVDLDNEQQRAICEYVFRVQIENHNKKIDNDLD